MLIAKSCRDCHRFLASDEFSPNRSHKFGRARLCRSCHATLMRTRRERNPDHYRAIQEKSYDKHAERRRAEARARYDAGGRTPRAVERAGWYLRQYGITIDQYNELLEVQAGLCALCGFPETHTQRGKVIRLAVDHCHTTGMVRGLLCRSCNQFLGRAEAAGLARLRAYAESFTAAPFQHPTLNVIGAR